MKDVAEEVVNVDETQSAKEPTFTPGGSLYCTVVAPISRGMARVENAPCGEYVHGILIIPLSDTSNPDSSFSSKTCGSRNTLYMRALATSQIVK